MTKSVISQILMRKIECQMCNGEILIGKLSNSNSEIIRAKFSYENCQMCNGKICYHMQNSHM